MACAKALGYETAGLGNSQEGLSGRGENVAGDEQVGKGMSEELKGSDYILWVLEILWFLPPPQLKFY